MNAYDNTASEPEHPPALAAKSMYRICNVMGSLTPLPM